MTSLAAGPGREALPGHPLPPRAARAVPGGGLGSGSSGRSLPARIGARGRDRPPAPGRSRAPRPAHPRRPWRAALATSAAVAAAMFLRPGRMALPLQPRHRDRRRRADVGVRLPGPGGFAGPRAGAAGSAWWRLSSRGRRWAWPRSPSSPSRPGASRCASCGSPCSPWPPRPPRTRRSRSGLARERLVADGWLRVLDPPEAFRNVYRSYAGLDRIGLRVAELLLAALVLALVRGAARGRGVLRLAARLALPDGRPRCWSFWRSEFWRRRPPCGSIRRRRSPRRSTSSRRWCASIPLSILAAAAAETSRPAAPAGAARAPGGGAGHDALDRGALLAAPPPGGRLRRTLRRLLSSAPPRRRGRGRLRPRGPRRPRRSAARCRG